MNIKEKKIVVFDLDGTLAESKQALDEDMMRLLPDLLSNRKVAIITGGGLPQLQKQVISKLPQDIEKLRKLYLFPTKGAAMYSFDGTDWQKIYQKKLTDEEKEKIIDAFDKTLANIDFMPKEQFGELLEDRGSQFTFSALGQDAPSELKKIWDKDALKRLEIKKQLDKYLSDFAVEIGGTSSIDITEKSIDKAYAIEKICEFLNLEKKDILFIGDAIFPGGNDYSVVKTGVDYINVADHNETKKIITDIIS